MHLNKYYDSISFALEFANVTSLGSLDFIQPVIETLNVLDFHVKAPFLHSKEINLYKKSK